MSLNTFGNTGNKIRSRYEEDVFVYILAFLLLITSFGQADAVTRTEGITDREIVESLTQIKGEIKVLHQRIDGLEKRIDGLEKRIDGLQGLMYVIIGAVIAQTMSIVGFVLWDRRSALAPAIKKNKELEEQQDKIVKVLKEFSNENPRLADIIKSSKLT